MAGHYLAAPRLRLVISWLSLIGLALPSFASDGYRSRTDERIALLGAECGERYGAPGAVGKCLLDEEKNSGERLAETYRALMKRLGQSRAAQKLRESQRNWLMYQSAYCESVHEAYKIEGPGISWAARSQCLLRTTMEREADLQVIFRDLYRAPTQDTSPTRP